MTDEKKELEIWQEYGDFVRVENLFKEGVDACNRDNAEQAGDVLRRLKDIKLRSERIINEEVKELIAVTEGYWRVTDIYTALHIVTKREKAAVRQAIHRLQAKGILEKYGERSDQYRRVEKDIVPMEIITGTVQDIKINLPLGISDYFSTYSKNVLMWAGSKDAGKTALFLDIAKTNMDKYQIHYFNSEMGDEEFSMRIQKHSDIPISKWIGGKFHPYARGGHFADVIQPNAINIIDYLEYNRDFSEIAEEIGAIHAKLNKGIAVIAIQKRYGSALGRGGDFTLQRPRLYVTLEFRPTDKTGVAKCFVAKSRKREDFNLAGKMCYYKLYKGWKIERIGDWIPMSEDPYKGRKEGE